MAGEQNKIILSQEAAELLGKRTPANTTKSNNTSLRAFCIFVVEHFCILKPEYISILKGKHDRSPRRHSLIDQASGLTHILTFRDSEGNVPPDGYENWTTEQLSFINNLLIEFVASYKKTGSNEDVKLTTIRSYITGLQRTFESEWGYKFTLRRGPVFGNEKTGLATVLDNKIRDLQAAGSQIESHNVMSKEDILKLYRSDALSKDNPKGFLTRTIFNIAFMTPFRPTELAKLKIGDVSKAQFGGEFAWRIVGRISCREGSSKTQGGGLKFVNVKPKEVCVWNRNQLDGQVNVYKDIEEYLSLTSRYRGKSDNFFLAVNYYAPIGDRTQFFEAVNLGKNTFVQYVQSACDSVGIIGSDVRKRMTVHGLRGTVITQLFEAGHADSSVTLCSGHRSMEAIKAYQIYGITSANDSKKTFLVRISSAPRTGNVRKLKVENMFESWRTVQDLTMEVMYDVEGGTSSVCGYEVGHASKGIPDQALKVFSHVGFASGSVIVNVNYYRESPIRSEEERTSRSLK